MGAQDKLIAHLEAQGASIRKSKKGIMIYGPPPTNGTMTMHNTPSDHRSLANDMAGLRRIGLTHPLDTKPLLNPAGDAYPAYMMGKLTKATESKARQILYSKGWPLEITAVDLHELGDLGTIGKCLYQLGYRWNSEGRKRSRSIIWVASAEIARLHDEVAAHPAPEDAFDAGQVPDVEVKLWEPELHCAICDSNTHGDIGHPFVDDHQGEEKGDDTQPSAPPVDFIDERDSWVVDLEELFGSTILRIMSEKLAVLHALGMGYEMRVWRKPTEGES